MSGQQPLGYDGGILRGKKVGKQKEKIELNEEKGNVVVVVVVM